MKSLNLNRIQTRMDELGLNQSSLSEKLSVSRESVSKWFKKESFPRPAYLLSLAKTLGLTFPEITLADSSPVGSFAYRTNLNHVVDKKRTEIAEDMLASLEGLKPYLDEQPLFGVAPLTRPVLEYGYIQRAAKDLRSSLGFGESGIVDEQALILFFRQHGTIFIPVLWGENGDNALHVCLADGETHFIYINLEKKLSDFKFWLVHELSHIITPKMSEQEADTFADMFAMAFLYPESCAKRLYARILPKEDVGYKINCIIEEASAFAISPVTIFKQLNAWASANDKPMSQFDMYGATQNYTKTVKLVSEVLFEEDQPAVDKYITVSRQVFGETFWNALAELSVKERKAHGFIQRILNIPIADAKGVWYSLTTGKDPA
jgi:transcriptional regulator with XRE-family HTH domain